MSEPELIRLENVTKTYHLGEIDVPVLKGISFTVRRGELVALMGASGSGKSTLMNVLGCLDRATSGSYYLDGEDISGLAPNERALVRTAKLGFVFQSFNLLTRTTALQNVLMPLDYSPSAPASREAVGRAKALLERVGLVDRMDHVPSQMSGGQQQRVAIARALINEPALLLADEPTGNLDSHTSVEILEMFQQLNAMGLTIIIVTHDPKVAGYADRVIRVVDGLIVEDDHGGRSINVTLTSTNGANGHANGEPATNGVNEPDPQLTADTGGGIATLAPPAKKLSPVATSRTVTKPASSKGPALSGLIPAPFRTAFTALRRNKMRSALTALGVIIGVSAVIAMVEISTGSKTALLDSMSSMGANTIMVRSGAAASGGITFGQGTLLTLTPGDAEAIHNDAAAIEAAAPIVGIAGQLVYGNRNWIPMNILGTTPAYLTIRDWTVMDEGQMFTDRNVRNVNKVCVIGATLVKELFDGASPVGKNLRVKNVSLRVVGVLGKKGSNMMGMDQDDILIAPWTTIKYRIADNSASANAATVSTTGTGTSTTVNSLNKLYPGSTSLYPVQSATQAANTPQPVRFTNVDQIMAKAYSAGQVQLAMQQIKAILQQRHRIRPGEDDDFNLRDMSEMIKVMGSMNEMMGGLLLIVALISLVVGGVGIMNIMLVSVTERTREIGLRMAVGARSHHILRQFLIEAMVLCLAGGAMGVLLGRMASLTVWYFLRWPIQASIPAIVAAFVVSAGIGIAFGFYPAWKASRLDPIEALRYE